MQANTWFAAKKKQKMQEDDKRATVKHQADEAGEDHEKEGKKNI